MLIVFKNGKELRVSKDVARDVLFAVMNHTKRKSPFNMTTNEKDLFVLLVNIDDISFIVDEEKIKNV